MELDSSSLVIEVSPDLVFVLELWQLGLGLLLTAAGFGILVLGRILGGPGTPERQVEVPLPTVDIASLEFVGPAAKGPQLELYGTPVRLAVVVLAPVGRDSTTVPPREELLQMLEQLVPRLGQVTSAHKPLVRIWPEQLSSQGFTNAFFNNLALPGDRGKGTPWCSVAGKFTVSARQYLIGLVCCGAQDNALAQIVIAHEGRWNDVLRVKS